MRAVAVTDLNDLPLILTLKEIAGIYRVSTWTIRRALQHGTFSPRPWDRYPYRWRREDIAADLKRKREDQVQRLHGFARSKAKPAKAALPSSTRAAR